VARSLGVALSSSAILASFFNTVFVIGPVVTPPGKTSRRILVFFLLSLLTSGLRYPFLDIASLGREEGPRGLSVDTDGVAD
jgi:hypothetical protein